MNITKESDSPTEVVLKVELAPEDEEPFITRSYRRIVSRINIPGFRRGKAPRSIVESQVGRTALVQEALEFMVPETLDQILKQENLQAFMEPDLEVLELEPVSFKAVVTLEPMVELGDLRSIKVEREPVEVTDKQVDEVIEQLRYESAPWEPVDRPAQFGDLLSLDVTGTINGEEVIRDENIDFIPQLDNPLPIPGFSVYLEGMAEGQEKEFTLTVPEDPNQEQFTGRECHLKVALLSVKAKTLPELDDEFAKGIRDGYESMEALTDYVRQQLTEAAENAAARRLEQEGLEELLKISTIQASDLLYQRETDRLYDEQERAVQERRLDMDTYLSHMGKSKEEWRKELEPQAERQLNNFLVVRKLAQHQGIEIEPDEVQAEIASMLKDAGDVQDQMRRILGSSNAQESIRSNLLNRKVMGRLAEIIQGEDADQASDDSQTAGQETASAAEATEESDESSEESKEGAGPNAE